MSSISGVYQTDKNILGRQASFLLRKLKMGVKFARKQVFSDNIQLFLI